ncbi:MAG TPA: carbohydrate kinase [Candidatus Limnocylindrales bacterium]|nr:carbohydrate kinase [Candidatus Limnocylindrales bacterium]
MGFKVIGLGEVLWDLLPGGRQLGGAPANFAFHAQALGADARVITRIGNDPLGQEILLRFQAMGFSTNTVQVDESTPTGTVTVSLDSKGVPTFVIHENVAWDRLELSDAAVEEVKGANAICFGSLAQRDLISRATIQALVATASSAALRVFDVNLRQNYYSPAVIKQSLRLANVCKLNDTELPIVGELVGLGGSTEKQIEALAERFGLQLVALTRGAEGSLLYQDGRWSEQIPKPTDVVDTVGAGDGFTAALVMGLLNRMDLDVVHALAAEVARYICSAHGATPDLPEHLGSKFLQHSATKSDAS